MITDFAEFDTRAVASCEFIGAPGEPACDLRSTELTEVSPSWGFANTANTVEQRQLDAVRAHLATIAEIEQVTGTLCREKIPMSPEARLLQSVQGPRGFVAGLIDDFSELDEVAA